MEKCEACGKMKQIEDLVQTPLGYYICDDMQECIAEFSGWNNPPEKESTNA